MIATPWQQILKTLEPDIDNLTAIMNAGPKVFPSMTQKGRKWLVRLKEGWDKLYDLQPLVNEDCLGEVVDWSTDQLKSWQDVRRTSYDTWEFKRKRDAEKFQTLFNLKWAR